MTLNISSSYTLEVKWEVLKHVLYTIQGCCIVLFNSLIVATILRHRALRETKEYLSLAALGLADALAGIGTLAAGVYRIPVWLRHRDQDAASGRFCLLTVHNIMWGWFSLASYTMLVVVSTDRLISVAIPLKHMCLSRKYMVTMVCVAYGISITNGVVIYGMNLSNTQPVYTKVCWTNEAFGIAGSYMNDAARAGFTLLSIGIYCFVPICYGFRNKVAVTPAGDSSQRVNRNKLFQKQINKAVSTSCLATFLFVGLPWVAHVWLLMYDRESYVVVAVWLFIVANVNPMLNLGIYYRKQSHFKVGFKALLKNRTLPDMLENWDKNRQAGNWKRSRNREQPI